MKMTNEEKKLIGLTRKLESPKCRSDLIFQAEIMIRTQRALKADYGIPEREPGTAAQPGRTA
jgi:hypothetical protein